MIGGYAPHPMTPGPSHTEGKAQTVARNTFWQGVEVLFGFLGSVVASVLVARVLGPVVLGPYSYIVWLTRVTTAVATFGLPSSTRKYMAEYLNSGQPGVARAIYNSSLRLQSLIS